jgi:hypothetical protein
MWRDFASRGLSVRCGSGSMSTTARWPGWRLRGPGHGRPGPHDLLRLGGGLQSDRRPPSPSWTHDGKLRNALEPNKDVRKVKKDWKEAQTVLYAWVRKAYQKHKDVPPGADIPKLIQSGTSEALSQGLLWQAFPDRRVQPEADKALREAPARDAERARRRQRHRHR